MIAFISACSGTAHPSQTPTTENREGAFKSLVLRNTQVSPDEAVPIAKEVCAALDRGVSVMSIAETMVQAMPAHDAGFIIGAGVTTFCPQHRAEIEAFRTSGT